MENHNLSISEIYKKYHTSLNGLNESQVEKLLVEFGQNSIKIEKKINPLSIFLSQFKNTLVIVLLIAAIVSLFIAYSNPDDADYVDSFLIFTIVIVNALFGFFQEYKAEKTIEALIKMSAPKAIVIRGGKEIEVPSEDVVPGDILVLHEGDKVAADSRIVECYSLYSDESSLTGESVPVQKSSETLIGKIPLAEMKNMLFMNSVITRGRGFAVVVSTGLSSEVGKIASEISQSPEKSTHFQKEIEDVGKKIMFLTFFILLFIVSSEFLMHSGDILFIFIAAVALGVAAIPEGLPAVVTLSLSIATNRMLSQKALTRRLSTIHDLGSINVICTDKTGTLTENSMTVTKIFIPGYDFDVTGLGTSTIGKFLSLNGKIDDLSKILKCAVLCNDAKKLDFFKGDPTEIAVLIPAYKAGLNPETLRIQNPRTDEIPFSSESKIMLTVHASTSYMKGAPEAVIEKCTKIQLTNGIVKLTKNEIDNIFAKNEEMAQSALRVLGFAYKEKDEFVFLGLMGMIDPPRSGVKEAIRDCRNAGIRVIMITGDNKFTASAIGKELGFNGKAITGAELDQLKEGEITKIVEEYEIYARTNPKHKVMLLKALKQNGHIVCMTGDGVNDAAAIKNSDVGIAMGIRGTEVSKQASDMIILDDNFITIRNAISEGRASFANIRKFVTLLLGANASEIIAVFLLTISPLGLSIKIAIQLLWINLLTDGLPALALGADPPSKGLMKENPRSKDERILNKNALYFIFVMGVVEALLVVVLSYYYFMTNTLIMAQTMFFTSFIIFENISVYLVRWRYKTPFFSNKWLHLSILLTFILQLILIYTDFSVWFNIVPIGIIDWAIIAFFGLIFILLIKIFMLVEKFFR